MCKKIDILLLVYIIGKTIFVENLRKENNIMNTNKFRTRQEFVKTSTHPKSKKAEASNPSSL